MRWLKGSRRHRSRNKETQEGVKEGEEPYFDCREKILRNKLPAKKTTAGIVFWGKEVFFAKRGRSLKGGQKAAFYETEGQYGARVRGIS